jgi:hypothetical protein
VTALRGEPEKQAIAICGWASCKGDPVLVAWARRHRRGAYGAPREISPVAPVDRGGHCRGSGRHRGDGCSLRGLVNVDALDPLDERVAV